MARSSRWGLSCFQDGVLEAFGDAGGAEPGTRGQQVGDAVRAEHVVASRRLEEAVGVERQGIAGSEDDGRVGEVHVGQAANQAAVLTDLFDRSISSAQNVGERVSAAGQGELEGRGRPRLAGTWDYQNIYPNASESTATPDQVLFTFKTPERDVLRIFLDARIQPAQQSGEDGWVGVLDEGGTTAARVDFSTVVLP